MASSSMDFATPTGITKTCKLARVQVEPRPMDELIHMRNQLGDRQLQAFRKKYGDILDLLHVSVHVDAIKTISQYWDNQLRCFILPHCHLTLALEEYAALMRMPIHEGTLVYSFPGHLPSKTQMAELLGLSLERVEFTKQGLIPLKFLMEYMAKLGKEKDSPLFGRVLALAIYGAVLFPAAKGAVDPAAISVFMAVERQRVNPVPAILADTIMTLTYCLGKGGGQLKCCLQLLTVWLGNHTFGKGWSRGVRLDQVHRPLRDFSRREGKILQDSVEGRILPARKDWVDLFKSLSSHDMRWKLVWWDNEEVLLSCGDFHNVPLVSARGGVNYNPSIALKQLAYEQKIPSQESLQPFFFFHGDQSKEWNDRITKAWKQTHFKGRIELGTRKVYSTPEFESWIHDGATEERSPTFPPVNPLMGKRDEEMKEALDARIARQKEEIENLMAKKERQRREIKKDEEEYVQLHRDLRGLKRRGEPARASREEELEQEVDQLRAEMAACRMKEHEMRERWEAEKKISGELRSMLEIERKKARDACEAKEELASHLEQERGASDILQEEIEEIANSHIKRVEELVWSRAEFQRESHELRNRHEQIVQWVNAAVPTFSETFYRAVDGMRPFYTPPELQSFLDLSQRLVEAWEDLRRSPV